MSSYRSMVGAPPVASSLGVPAPCIRPPSHPLTAGFWHCSPALFAVAAHWLASSKVVCLLSMRLFQVENALEVIRHYCGGKVGAQNHHEEDCVNEPTYFYCEAYGYPRALGDHP